MPQNVGMPENQAIRRPMRWLTISGICASGRWFRGGRGLDDLVDFATWGGFFFVEVGSKGSFAASESLFPDFWDSSDIASNPSRVGPNESRVPGNVPDHASAHRPKVASVG